MKIKSSIIFLTLLLLVNLINGATLYTPNGKSINTFDANRSSYNSAHFEAYKSNNFGTDNLYPNSEVLGQYEDGLWEYNCHVFAWNNWQGTEKWNSESDMWKLGKPSPNDLMWRNFPDVWYEDSDNPIGIVSYIEANNSSEASIVTYKLNNTITHSARIVGSGYRYISKWGSNPIIKHPPTETPIDQNGNSIYGDPYKDYKINPAYRPVGSGDPAGRNYQTINNALSGIPNGGYIRVYSGTYNENSFIIPNNKTVKIEPGTIIIFSENSNLGVEGILYAQGTSTNPIIFKSNTGTWNGIHVFDNGDFIKNEYCQIQNLPLSVKIKSIGNDKYEAEVSGGTETYTDYKWWYRNDDGIIPKNGSKAPPVGVWLHNSYWDDKNTITFSPSYSPFSLKCRVTDSDGTTDTDIYSGGIWKGSQENQSTIPNTIVLGNNSPNPFNPTTQIKFGLPQQQKIKIDVYSITGQKIKTLVDNTMSAGYHTINWNATNANGAKVSSGVYIFQLRCGNEVFTKKMIFAK